VTGTINVPLVSPKSQIQSVYGTLTDFELNKIVVGDTCYFYGQINLEKTRSSKTK
jgi:hypothetical protein